MVYREREREKRWTRWGRRTLRGRTRARTRIQRRWWRDDGDDDGDEGIYSYEDEGESSV